MGGERGEDVVGYLFWCECQWEEVVDSWVSHIVVTIVSKSSEEKGSGIIWSAISTSSSQVSFLWCFFFNFFVYLSCWLDLLDGWIDCCLFLFRWVFIWSMMEQVLAVFELWSEERLRQWLSDLWLWSIIYFYLKKKLSVCEQSMILKCIIGCIYYSYFIFIINILLQITLHLKLFLTDFFD